MSNKEIDKVNERAIIRVLQGFSDKELKEFSDNGCYLADIVQLINDKRERFWTKFMVKFYEKYDAYIDNERKKNYNPDVEYLEKHPDTDIYKTND